MVLKFIHAFQKQKLEKVYKPLLSEVFKMSDSLNSNIRYNIELKAQPDYDNIYTPTPKVFVKLVLDVINDNKVSERTNLQSFDLRILEEIKKQDADMHVALLVDEDETIAYKLSKLSYEPEIISPYYGLLNKATVEGYQNQGYKIIPWTVNDKEAIIKMISYDVDGIITDYPDQLISILDN